MRAKIDNTLKNSKCRLFGERDETVNQIINECSKLAQKEFKNKHDWVGKVIHWELCKKVKFRHTTKWYMQKPETVLENETYQIFLNLEIQMGHLILARKPGLVLPNKRNLSYSGFSCPNRPQNEIKSERKQKAGQISGPCQRYEKAVEHESDNNTSRSW